MWLLLTRLIRIISIFPLFNTNLIYIYIYICHWSAVTRNCIPSCTRSSLTDLQEWAWACGRIQATLHATLTRLFDFQTWNLVFTIFVPMNWEEFFLAFGSATAKSLPFSTFGQLMFLFLKYLKVLSNYLISLHIIPYLPSQNVQPKHYFVIADSLYGCPYKPNLFFFNRL